MQSDRLRVSVTRQLPKVVERRMEELFDVELRINDTPMTKNELIEVAKSLGVSTSGTKKDLIEAILAA